jgi:hypothetical protein
MNINGGDVCPSTSGRHGRRKSFWRPFAAQLLSFRDFAYKLFELKDFAGISR